MIKSKSWIRRGIPNNKTMFLKVPSKYFLNSNWLGSVHRPAVEPVAVLDHPLSEEPFPNTQPAHLAMQLRAVLSGPKVHSSQTFLRIPFQFWLLFFNVIKIAF